MWLKLRQLIFGSGPRISRRQFWTGLIMAIVVWNLAGFALMTLALSIVYFVEPAILIYFSKHKDNFDVVLRVFFFLTFVPFLLALCIKRLRDRARPPQLVFLVCIPVIDYFAAPWLAIECGFLRGSAGSNRYGPDPLAADVGNSR